MGLKIACYNCAQMNPVITNLYYCITNPVMTNHCHDEARYKKVVVCCSESLSDCLVIIGKNSPPLSRICYFERAHAGKKGF